MTKFETRDRFMRPPYGSIDERVRAIMVAMDIVPIMWNVDSNDWQLNSYPAYAGFPAVNPSMTPAQVIASWTTLLAQPRSNGTTFKLLLFH